ncbi:ricin B lectin domain-containing protein [Xylariaceae sp. FL0016]|nr:ricin B lectin domain-containing protein [Xylariaceae sp. FL0016]
MLAYALMILSFAAAGFSQAPEGYRKVMITSNVNDKFVVVPKAPVASGSGLVVQTRTDKADQHWYIKDGTGSKIQLVDTTFCIDAGAKSNWKDMGALSVKNCSDTEPAQKWNVMADGRIALEGSTPQECVDLQYMRATANNPVGLYSCAGLGNTGAADKGINWPLVNVTG